jgi:hypothetical protein
MKKALVILGMAALVASANAGIRFFFTSSADAYGLTNPANALKPSTAITSNDDVPDTTDNVDFTSGDYAVGTFPAYTTAPVTVDRTAGEFVYLWMQFYNDASAGGALDAGSKFVTAEFKITNHLGQTVGVNPVYYRGDDSGGDFANKCWDGASTELDNYSTFRQNPQTLAAVDSPGIVNSNSGGQGQSPMWKGGTTVNGTTNRIQLLGAIEGLANDTYTFFHTYAADTSSTVVLKRAGTNTPIEFAPVSFEVTPEPASMVLMALAGLLIRRR